MDKITGKQNQLIKDTKKLLVSAKARRDARSFVLEGARLCFDVLHSFYTVALVLVTADCMARYPAECAGCVIGPIGRWRSAARWRTNWRRRSTPKASSVCAKCRRRTLPLRPGALSLWTGCRIPAIWAPSPQRRALGIAGLLAYNCCDVYNPKALRASMGSLLRLPVTVSHDLREDLLLYKAEGFQVLGTVPVDTAAKITETHFTKSSICVIGNEGNGISQGVKQVCDDLVTIPMKGRAESLNASVAAAITMWEMMR